MSISIIPSVHTMQINMDRFQESVFKGRKYVPIKELILTDVLLAEEYYRTARDMYADLLRELFGTDSPDGLRQLADEWEANGDAVMPEYDHKRLEDSKRLLLATRALLDDEMEKVKQFK